MTDLVERIIFIYYATFLQRVLFTTAAWLVSVAYAVGTMEFHGWCIFFVMTALLALQVLCDGT